MLNQTKYNSITVIQSSLTEQSMMIECPSQADKAAILQSYTTDRADELLAAHQTQIDRLLPLRHTNLQSTIDVFVEEHNLHLVTGAVQGKPLATLVPLSEERCEKLLKNILPVLSYLHERQIVHGNISPQTIILTSQGQPILTNFQAITELIAAAGGDVKPTIAQQLNEIPVANIPSGQQFDLYSLGATIIYLLTNRELIHLYDPNTQKWQWETHFRPSSSKLMRAIDLLLNNHNTSATEVLQEFQTQSKLILDTPPPTQDFSSATSSLYTSTPTSPTNIPQSENKVSPRNTNSAQSNNRSTQSGNKPFPTILTIGAVGGLMMFVGMSIGKNNSNAPVQTSSGSSQINVTPSIVNNSSPSPINQSPPEDLIAQYYQAINSKQYQTAWDKLPPNMQEDRNLHPNGYQSYTDFFNNFNSLHVNNLKTIERTNSNAIVSADLSCELKNGDKSPLFLRYFMNWNNSDRQWQISKIKLDPDRQSSCGTNTSNLASNDASKLISQWLDAKKSIFGSSYNKSAGENLTTGLAYERNITANPGTEESSVDDLFKNGLYYSYDRQQVHEIKEIRSIGSDEVKVVALVSEQRTLHNTRSGSTKTSFTNAAKSCYQFKKIGNDWKILKTPELFTSCP
jgi:serine/threonine protein kinase, bacterial